VEGSARTDPEAEGVEGEWFDYKKRYNNFEPDENALLAYAYTDMVRQGCARPRART
jgi:hypothetical protein